MTGDRRGASPNAEPLSVDTMQSTVVRWYEWTSLTDKLDERPDVWGQSQPRSAGPVDERPIGDQEDRPKKRRLSFEQSCIGLSLVMSYVLLFFFVFLARRIPVLR